MHPDVASLPTLPVGDTGSVGVQPLLPALGVMGCGWGSQDTHWRGGFLLKIIPCCFSGVLWVGAGMQDTWVPSSCAGQARPCNAPGVSPWMGPVVVPDAPSPAGTSPGASHTIWLNKHGFYQHQSGFPAIPLVCTNPVLGGRVTR